MTDVAAVAGADAADGVVAVGAVDCGGVDDVAVRDWFLKQHV